MPKVIEAIFENGVIKPLGELHLKNHQRVRIKILSGEGESSVKSQKKILLEFAGLVGRVILLMLPETMTDISIQRINSMSGKKIFIDTSAWYAIIDINES